MPEVAGRTVRARCPHCLLSLDESDDGFRCVTGHHFDRAREGYVNLLIGGRLKGKQAGDDEGMVAARRLVFDAALYAPVHRAVAEAVGDAEWVLDAGCGEGTYLAAVLSAGARNGWGIDVSRPAIRLAAKRHRHDDTVRFAVASSHHLPFDDGVFDAIINVFSPRIWPEMARVLRPGGRAVVVSPEPGHLRQLRELVYAEDAVTDDDPTSSDVEAAHLDVVRRSSVDFRIDLPADLRLPLAQMTPFWWRTTADSRASIAAELASVDVRMRLELCRK